MERVRFQYFFVFCFLERGWCVVMEEKGSTESGSKTWWVIKDIFARLNVLRKVFFTRERKALSQTINKLNLYAISSFRMKGCSTGHFSICRSFKHDRMGKTIAQRWAPITGQIIYELLTQINFELIDGFIGFPGMACARAIIWTGMGKSSREEQYWLLI